MKTFRGMEIRPYCQVSDLPRVRIDRVRVQVRRTLFGETEYDIIGTMGEAGVGWPVCRPLDKLDEVWPEVQRVERMIENERRRQEDENAKSGVAAPEGAV